MSATEANQSPAAQQIQMIAFGDFELRVCFTHSFLSPRGEQSADGLSEKSRPPNCALPLLASAVCAAESAPQASLWSSGGWALLADYQPSAPHGGFWPLCLLLCARLSFCTQGPGWTDNSTDLGNLLLN